MSRELYVPDEADRHDLGNGHFYLCYVDSDDRWIGIIEYHPHLVTGEQCGGSVLFESRDGRPSWQVESWDPLTLSPSILCAPDKGGCGMHGYIQEGRWVSA